MSLCRMVGWCASRHISLRYWSASLSLFGKSAKWRATVGHGVESFHYKPTIYNFLSPGASFQACFFHLAHSNGLYAFQGGGVISRTHLMMLLSNPIVWTLNLSFVPLVFVFLFVFIFIYFCFFKIMILKKPHGLPWNPIKTVKILKARHHIVRPQFASMFKNLVICKVYCHSHTYIFILVVILHVWQCCRRGLKVTFFKG